MYECSINNKSVCFNINTLEALKCDFLNRTIFSVRVQEAKTPSKLLNIVYPIHRSAGFVYFNQHHQVKKVTLYTGEPLRWLSCLSKHKTPFSCFRTLKWLFGTKFFQANKRIEHLKIITFFPTLTHLPTSQY